MFKFCVKLKKTVTEMKEMLDAVYNDSTTSHPFIVGITSLKVAGRMRNCRADLAQPQQC